MFVPTMVMVTIAQAAILLLLWAGIGHTRRPQALRHALAVQGLLPGRALKPVAAALPVAEIAVGGGAMAALMLVPQGTWPALVAVAILYLTFAAYAAAVLWVRPQSPCGCFGDDTKITVGVVVRAAGGAAAAGLSAVTLGGPALPASARLLSFAAGLALAVIARSPASAGPTTASAART